MWMHMSKLKCATKTWSLMVMYMWSQPYVNTCKHTMQPIGLSYWQHKWYAAKLLKISSSTEKRARETWRCGQELRELLRGRRMREGGRSVCVYRGGSIVEKLDIASLLHLTPSTSDLLDITECTYRKASNDQHPIQLLTNTSQSFFTTFKMR